MKKIQELVIVKVKHLVESSTPGQNPDYFRHVEEVVNCGSLLGQLGDPLGQFQAAGIYLKSCLELSPCLGEALSIKKPSRRSYCDPCHGGILTLLFAQV